MPASVDESVGQADGQSAKGDTATAANGTAGGGEIINAASEGAGTENQSAADGNHFNGRGDAAAAQESGEQPPVVRLRPKKAPLPPPKPLNGGAGDESLGIDSKPHSKKATAMKIEELQENGGGEAADAPQEELTAPVISEANGTANGHHTDEGANGHAAAAEEQEERAAVEEEADSLPDMIQGVDSHTAALLRRTMGVLYEASPGHEDNTEEIRRLDSQLDHLSEYMDRVEQRLKEHNEKLMETLRQQKEDREKRRRSFHERLEASQREDDDFQRQLSQILNRVDISRNRLSLHEPATGQHAGDEAAPTPDVKSGEEAKSSEGTVT